MVESQHIAATMKLVDTRDEQDLLETMLESSKPVQPDDTAGLDYLLATPFRYHPRRGGSRFRSATDPGVFYGAESVRTAGAELGYWRWKFLQDAVDLDRIEPVAHTAFSGGHRHAGGGPAKTALSCRRRHMATPERLRTHATVRTRGP